MLTRRLPELLNPPPPSTLVPGGQTAVADACVPAELSTVPLTTTWYFLVGTAQTAYTTKLVAEPLLLFTSAPHPLPFGNELLMLAPRLELSITAPPPCALRGCAPFEGHATVPRVCAPLATG